MALAVNNIVQITDVQTYLGQTMLNVYFYRVTALEPAADYSDLAEAFDNVVRSKVKAIQSTSVVHPFIQVKNLSNGIDIHDQIDSQNGMLASGDDLASFYALGFRLVRTNATTRHGSKRIGGIGEAVTYGNDIIAAYLDEAAALATALASPIVREGTVDHDLSAQPVIVGRYPQGHAQAGELNLAVINPVQSAQFIRVTTQTTRRAGRGV